MHRLISILNVKLYIALVLILVPVHLEAFSQGDEDFEVDIGFEPENLESAPEEAKAKPTRSLKRLWGVPDTQATVGKVFRYRIPKDAFDGVVDEFQVDGLPEWLSLDSREKMFVGVPPETSVGYSYVNLVATAKDCSPAVDKFAIKVAKQDGRSLLSESGCVVRRGADDATVLSVLVMLPTSFTPHQRVKLVQNMAAIIGLPTDQISLLSASDDYDPLEDRSAILGKVANRNHWRSSESSKKVASLLQCPVGCNGELSREGRKFADLVRQMVADGRMAKLLDVDIDSWHVTQVEPSSMRVRRDLSELSGDGSFHSNSDYTDYNDNEYYDYENYDNEPIFELAKKKDDTKKTEEEASVGVPGETPVLTTTRTTDSPFATAYTPLVLTTPLYADYTSPVVNPTGAPYESTTHFIDPARTFATEETTVTSVINFNPRVVNRIQKLSWEVGNVYRHRIPANTFEDMEDGNTRNLTLIMKEENGTVLGKHSWIQFDPVKQEIYALPLEKDFSRYNYILEAFDREQKSTTDLITVRLRQPQEARNYHHQFSAELKVKKSQIEFGYSLDWQVKAVRKIARLYGDGNLHSINIRNISMDPIKISWTNVSLVDSSSTVCPTEQLEDVSRILIESDGSSPTRQASKVFLPEFQVKRVQALYFQPCEKLNSHHIHHGHHHPDMSHAEGKEVENGGPLVRNHINSITAKAGSLYRFQVPFDTCYDHEEGDARNLRMQLLTDSRLDPPKTNWLQFDKANQEFFGLPLAKDIGTKSYILDCIDSEHVSVSNALFVHVEEQDDGDEAEPIPPVRFSMTVDGDFDEFNSNANKKSMLVVLIASAFGDGDASNVVVENLESGSIKVEWVNSSLPVDPCPQDEILKLREIMTDSNGVLKKSFIEGFTPDFKIVKGSVTPSGSCLAGDTPTHPEEPFTEVSAGSSNEVTGPSEDYLLTFIVPAVIIAVMLLLAAIVACCLYRRRRYGKMSMTDDRTFVSKGIPIIFAEELDDHRNDSAKTPTVLRDEKPPLPPPEYQRGKGEGEPLRGSREIREGSNGDQPYQPPPPFTASNGASRNTRPSMPPAYRKPPNYCPP